MIYSPDVESSSFSFGVRSEPIFEWAAGLQAELEAASVSRPVLRAKLNALTRRVCAALGLPPILVQFGEASACTFTERALWLHLAILDDPYDVVSTLLHELRHYECMWLMAGIINARSRASEFGMDDVFDRAPPVTDTARRDLGRAYFQEFFGTEQARTLKIRAVSARLVALYNARVEGGSAVTPPLSKALDRALALEYALVSEADARATERAFAAYLQS